MEKPAVTDRSRPPSGEASEWTGARPNRLGPTTYGNAPVVVAGVMVGGALLLGGWGVAQVASGHRAKEHPAAVAPSDPGPGEARKNGDGTVTVRLPDGDDNGIPDAFEGPGGGGGAVRSDPGSNPPQERNEGSRPESPKGNSDPVPPPAVEPPKPALYTIKKGDTLISISARTGVPVGVLVQTNRIQNPNLIYAGSALLIPPVS